MPKLERSLLPRNSRVTEHLCSYCQVVFFSTKPKSKFCSDKCRVYFHIYTKKQISTTSTQETKTILAAKTQEETNKVPLENSVNTDDTFLSNKQNKSKNFNRALKENNGQLSLFPIEEE